MFQKSVKEQKKFACFLLANSHIDVAWLWNTDETKDVCYKTFNHVVNLLMKYPELIYAQSSALFYMWIEREYPELFKKIKKLVAEKRWEIVGGSLVEFDANIPQGESLVRQFLIGKYYFLKKFNVDVKVCFLPDTFGFPASLPQILRKAGIEYFVTHKLNWNDTILFPFHLFRWKGIDGTEIISYQGVSGYDTRLNSIEELMSYLKKMIQVHKIPFVLILFGKGDHGGGPEEYEIRNVRKWTQLLKVVDLKYAPMIEFFNEIKKYADKIPVWTDELYLQFHRGVFTAQAHIKYLNRKCENLLLDTEKILILSKIICGINYPKEELREIWIKLLTNHFHDILCGSLSQDAFNETIKRYITVFRKTLSVLSFAAKALSRKIGGILIINTLNWSRDELIRIKLNKDFVITDSSNIIPFQVLREDDKTKEILLYVKDIPPLGFKVLQTSKKRTEYIHKDGVSVMDTRESIILENKYLRIVISKKTGRIISVIYKCKKLNILRAPITIRIYKDSPSTRRKSILGVKAYLFDAWEIFAYDQRIPEYDDLIKPVSVKILEKGPLRAKVLVSYQYKQGRRRSVINVLYTLVSEKQYFEIEFLINWHAKHRYAKLLIPLSLNFDGVVYEIPYGVIYRRNPFAKNVSLFEKAKYEVPALRWLDAYDKKLNIGVAVINDSRYGFGQRNSVIHVSLLRSAVFPSKTFFFSRISQAIFDAIRGIKGSHGKIAKILEKTCDVVLMYLAKILGFHITDQGRHKMKIAIYPHEGNWQEARVPEIAAEINHPVYVIYSTRPILNRYNHKYSLLSIEPSFIHVTAIKEHENLPLIVIRFFETRGRRSSAKIKFHFDVEDVYLLDLLERKIQRTYASNDTVVLHFEPFEIKTVAVKPKLDINS